MQTRSLIAVVGGFTFLSLGTSAFGQQMLGIDFDTTTLYDINKTTGATSNPRQSLFQATDIAASPVTGTIYATNAVVGTGSSLYTINRTTGATTVVGPTGLPSNIEGDLAFNSAGVLYGITFTGQLYTVNLGTGTATTVGTLPSGVSDVSGLFFSGGSLYAIDTRISSGTNARLYQINPTNGAILTNTALNIISPSALAGAEADPSTGIVYVGVGSTSSAGSTVPGTLYTLNVGASTLTSVGLLNGLPEISGLTFVPEPASVAVFAASAVLGLRRRRR